MHCFDFEVEKYGACNEITIIKVLIFIIYATNHDITKEDCCRLHETHLRRKTFWKLFETACWTPKCVQGFMQKATSSSSCKGICNTRHSPHCVVSNWGVSFSASWNEIDRSRMFSLLHFHLHTATSVSFSTFITAQGRSTSQNVRMLPHFLV